MNYKCVIPIVSILATKKKRYTLHNQFACPNEFAYFSINRCWQCFLNASWIKYFLIACNEWLHLANMMQWEPVSEIVWAACCFLAGTNAHVENMLHSKDVVSASTFLQRMLLSLGQWSPTMFLATYLTEALNIIMPTWLSHVFQLKKVC